MGKGISKAKQMDGLKDNV